jgi:hypothetical protein
MFLHLGFSKNNASEKYSITLLGGSTFWKEKTLQKECPKRGLAV